MKVNLIRTMAIIMLVVVLLAACNSEDKNNPSDVAGIWSGTYAYDCKSNAFPPGSSPLTMEITQYGDLLSGTASYLDGVTSLNGKVIGNTVYLSISGSSAITQNLLTGTVSGDSIIGTALNGENCTAPTGPSGTFTLNKSTPSIALSAKLKIIGPAVYTKKTCAVYTVEVQDVSGNPSQASNDATILLSGTGSGKFYRDAICSAETNSLTIPAGGMSQNFFFNDAVAENTTLTVTDSSNYLAADNLIVTITDSGGAIIFGLNDVQSDHSTNASAQYWAAGNTTRIDGNDGAGNFFQIFVHGNIGGPYTCGNMYYQDATGRQWGAGGSIGGSCSIAVTSYGTVGQLIIGTFSGSLVAQFGGATGNKSVSNGSVSVYREPNQ